MLNMTSNAIAPSTLQAANKFYKDDACMTFKEGTNENEFVDFLTERDNASAWIETDVTTVQFEPMFSEPMYVAGDSAKYGIPAEILQEAAANSRLYGVVRAQHYPVGLSATESLVNYSKLTRDGFSWMRRVSPPNLAAGINNGIDAIRYDDRRSSKCLVKIGDEMIRAVVSARYAPMPSGSLFKYATMEYFPDTWPEATFLHGYWTHSRVRGVWSLEKYSDKIMKTLGQLPQLKEYFPALSIENSDTTASAIRLRPLFLSNQEFRELPLLNGTRTAHLGAEKIHDRLEADFQMVMASFQQAEQDILELNSIRVEYGYNTLIRCLRQGKVNLPVAQAKEAAENFLSMNGRGACTALEVYFAVADAYNFVVRDFPDDKEKIVRASDAVVSAMKSPWRILDGAGEVSL